MHLIRELGVHNIILFEVAFSVSLVVLKNLQSETLECLYPSSPVLSLRCFYQSFIVKIECVCVIIFLKDSLSIDSQVKKNFPSDINFTQVFKLEKSVQISLH